MQKHLAIGRRVKILDQKNQGGVQQPPPPASLRVKIAREVLNQFPSAIDPWVLARSTYGRINHEEAVGEGICKIQICHD